MERHSNERNPSYLFLGLTVLTGLAAYMNIFAPDTVARVAVFFLLTVISVGCIGLFLFRTRRHALIISVGLLVYLLLRTFGLRQPFYAVLLLASMLAVEYLMKDRI